MAVDIYRGTSNIALPDEVSEEIWGKTVEDSFFMTAARQIRIPGTGTAIQVIAGEPVADWVDETDAKPVSTSTFSKKTLVPYKLAVIEPFSSEFVHDLPALYEELRRRLPYALAAKFDATIMGTTAPGTGFDVLGGASTVGIGGTDVYGALVTAEGNIASAGGIATHIGLAPQGRSLMLGAVDQVGHPLFTQGVGSAQVGTVLGAETHVARALYVAGTQSNPNVVGIIGDFRNAVWGSVEGIQIGVSDQATLTSGASTINLWQQNMVAVRAEIRVAFGVESASEFNILTDAQ